MHLVCMDLSHSTCLLCRMRKRRRMEADSNLLFSNPTYHKSSSEAISIECHVKPWKFMKQNTAEVSNSSQLLGLSSSCYPIIRKTDLLTFHFSQECMAMLESAPPSGGGGEKLNNQDAACSRSLQKAPLPPDHPDNSINNLLEEHKVDSTSCKDHPVLMPSPVAGGKNIYKPGRVKNVNEEKLSWEWCVFRTVLCEQHSCKELCDTVYITVDSFLNLSCCIKSLVCMYRYAHGRFCLGWNARSVWVFVYLARCERMLIFF